MSTRSALVPTGRAALLVAAAAPVALLVAVMVPALWAMAPLIGTLVIAMVVIDALAAGSLRSVRVSMADDFEVGAAGPIDLTAEFSSGLRGHVEAALASDARLFPAGRALADLAKQSARSWTGRITLTPQRRGTGEIEQVWLRWTGPLGLGARQAQQPVARAVRVWPNLSPVRSPAMQAFLRNFEVGLIARRIRGEGTMFEALAEYQPGMDKRRIDWKSSARHAHLYAKEFEAERNNQIVFAFDCGQAMCEPVGGQNDAMPRIDRAVTAALTTAYAALKSGDKVALFGFAARPQLFTPFASDAREFYRLQVAAAGLDYMPQEPNFTLALATLAGQLKRRSMIVVFSDFTDPTSAELMIESISRLTARHLVLFVTMHDEELAEIASAAPNEVGTLAMAVSADGLLRQRALVLGKLRAIGVQVVEAPYAQIGTRLLDRYLSIKRRGAIG
ncbi:MAG: DUF58 domain-containing protein [Novosphingobium sp.]|uniref:DUF58 domain-containing protein n=1 Tax=Novosphingobium sp. TaxID=1874826 RepID=UPI0032BA053D